MDWLVAFMVSVSRGGRSGSALRAPHEGSGLSGLGF